MTQKIWIGIILGIIMGIPMVLALQPFGATVTHNNSSTAQADAAESHTALAGNVTQIDLSGYSTTQSWQGYYGNVSGTIFLADSSDNQLYNWTLASPQGEVYASTNGTLDWTNVQCLNLSADGTFADDTGNAGATSQFGTNLTLLEANFSIDPAAVDGVDETFTLTGIGTHDPFYTNSLFFSEGECTSTRLFGDTNQGVNDEFEEVLLYDPVSRSVIFTAILDEDVLGFDDRSHDFEMIVLEDGHGTDTSSTTYYFYIELE